MKLIQRQRSSFFKSMNGHNYYFHFTCSQCQWTDAVSRTLQNDLYGSKLHNARNLFEQRRPISWLSLCSLGYPENLCFCLTHCVRIFPLQMPQNTRNRSSYQRCFIKKGVLKNFTKFTGKLLYQSFFFNKVAVFAGGFIWILRNF